MLFSYIYRIFNILTIGFRHLYCLDDEQKKEYLEKFYNCRANYLDDLK